MLYCVISCYVILFYFIILFIYFYVKKKKMNYVFFLHNSFFQFLYFIYNLSTTNKPKFSLVVGLNSNSLSLSLLVFQRFSLLSSFPLIFYFITVFSINYFFLIFNSFYRNFVISNSYRSTFTLLLTFYNFYNICYVVSYDRNI